MKKAQNSKLVKLSMIKYLWHFRLLSIFLIFFSGFYRFGISSIHITIHALIIGTVITLVVSTVVFYYLFRLLKYKRINTGLPLFENKKQIKTALIKLKGNIIEETENEMVFEITGNIFNRNTTLRIVAEEKFIFVNVLHSDLGGHSQYSYGLYKYFAEYFEIKTVANMGSNSMRVRV